MKIAKFTAALLIAGTVVIGPRLVRSQTTKPDAVPVVVPAAASGAGSTAAALTTAAPSALELRATQAFSRGEYSLALPMLKKVALALKDQPDRVGPIQEQIRVCEKNIANPPKVAVAAIAAVDPQAALTNVRAAAQVPMDDTRHVHPAPTPGQTLILDIKELGNFEFDSEKGGNIPDDVKKLNGVKLRTHGFMIPLDQAENITQFALVPSLFNCCFGQPPQVQHNVVVDCPKGKAVNYYPDEITVEGKLKVEEKKDDDGIILYIFEMEASSIRPTPR